MTSGDRPEAVGSYIRLDGATWPHHRDPGKIEWQLRYGDAEKVRLVAASYVHAYCVLVDMPSRRRAKVISRLRSVLR